MNTEQLLEWHTMLVETPSVSGSEETIASLVESFFVESSLSDVTRIGNSAMARVPASNPGAPVVVFNSHLDTVPPVEGWTGNPHRLRRSDGILTGLGSNDAKASVACMTAAALRFAQDEYRYVNLIVAFAEQEETTGLGSSQLISRLDGESILGCVIGEPTDLQIAIEQKGLLIADVVHRGESCHAANASAVQTANPVHGLAKDLLAIAEAGSLGQATASLGAATIQPTMLSAGIAKNVIPPEARATLDIRTVPSATHDQYLDKLRRIVEGSVEVQSSRLVPVSTREDEIIVLAALEAGAGQSRTFGSSTMSDMVFFGSAYPSIKVGPGSSSRSHTADEWVTESELVQGADYYLALLRSVEKLHGGEPS